MLQKFVTGCNSCNAIGLNSVITYPFLSIEYRYKEKDPKVVPRGKGEGIKGKVVTIRAPP